MREITFKGFCESNIGTETIKVNGNKIKGLWVYGDLLKGLFIDDTAIRTGLGISVEVIPETVSQYTGLSDIKGTKIFEGDVVKDKSGNIYTVSWDKYRFLISDEYENVVLPEQWVVARKELEIIGNIWVVEE